MNYQVQAGTLLEDFEAIGDWTITTSGALGAFDTTYFKIGTGSLKVTSGSGTNGNATKTVNVDLSNNNIHGFWVYLPDVSKVSDISVLLSNDTTFTNYFNIAFTNTNTKLYNGWNFFTAKKSDWTTNGAAVWTSNMVRLRVRVTALASVVAEAYFDSYYVNPYSRPKCLIHFDDVPSTAYTIGYPYMKSRHLKGTLFPAGSFIDTSTYMTTAQLQEVYADGWDIGNHTYNHTNLTTLSTQQEMEDEIALAQEWMIGKGFIRGANHFAYPNGGRDETAIAATQARGMLTARTTSFGSRIYQAHTKGIDHPNALHTGGVLDTTTLATAKSAVDAAIQIGGTAIFVFHSLVATATINTHWVIADFQALIDYIVRKQNEIDVVTTSEWHRGLSGGRKIA